MTTSFTNLQVLRFFAVVAAWLGGAGLLVVAVPALLSDVEFSRHSRTTVAQVVDRTIERGPVTTTWPRGSGPRPSRQVTEAAVVRFDDAEQRTYEVGFDSEAQLGASVEVRYDIEDPRVLRAADLPTRHALLLGGAVACWIAGGLLWRSRRSLLA